MRRWPVTAGIIVVILLLAVLALFLLVTGGDEGQTETGSSQPIVSTPVRDASPVTGTDTTEAPPAEGPPGSGDDRAALVALYQATGGPGWLDNTNWLTDAPIGEWFGVDTDASGQVFQLDLTSNELKGPLPPELGSLASLEYLILINNSLTGPIPPELGNLSKLRVLDLPDNELRGPIPAELANLPNLENLNLGGNPAGNMFTGCVPGGLDQVKNNDLDFLDLPSC
ncbi:MAG: hypothetical protein OXI91_05920 [Chloroflexota bacterium]|nr:hypothetical protein [Chloroflexota bacterium]